MVSMEAREHSPSQEPSRDGYSSCPPGCFHQTTPFEMEMVQWEKVRAAVMAEINRIFDEFVKSHPKRPKIDKAYRKALGMNRR